MSYPVCTSLDLDDVRHRTHTIDRRRVTLIAERAARARLHPPAPQHPD